MTMAVRKLQAEIDRTLKGVAQGVELFEQTFDKLNHSNNATQKDKLENDLKTQIKKLQRMRDQIKAWASNNDIKDKAPLAENRRLIETQMERFKALEKEMKMKAFSREGLIAQSKLDPAEKAKRDIIDWIGTTIEELARQIELTESEAEALTSGKKKKGQGDRLHELDELNERRTWHTGRLEVVQRMLENGQLSVDQVEEIQEDVNYFVEANGEEDFDYDTGLYDELNLQDEEDIVGDFGPTDDLSNLDSASVGDIHDDISAPASVSAPAPLPVSAPAVIAPKTPAKEEKEKKSTPASKSSKDASEEQPPSPVSAKKQISRKSTMEIKISPAPIPQASTPAKAEASAPTPKAAALPPIRYAAAAAAAVASSSMPSVPPPSGPEEGVKAKTEAVVSPPDVEEEEPPVQEVAPVIAPPSEDSSNGHAPPPPPGLSRSPAPSLPAQSSEPPSEDPSASIPSLTQNVQSLSIGNGSSSPYVSAPSLHAESSRAPSAFSGTSPRPVPQGVLGSLMQSFDTARTQAQRRGNDVGELQQALEGSYASAPIPTDSEAPRYYYPKNPIKTPSHYPQTRPPIFEDKALYPRLDIDQLFYVFYYMTGTYEQWLAAQELKRNSWRFHKQYLTWFQRAHNPQAITEDYEQGGYFYFDWENSWCQRKKSDFRFEYRWLSEH